MVARRSQAIGDHDLAGFAATVGGSTRSVQLAEYRTISRLPVDIYQLTPRGAITPHGDGSYGVDVDESTGLDIEDSSVSVTHHYLVSFTAGTWVVVRDTIDPRDVRSVPWELSGSITDLVADDHLIVVTKGVDAVQRRRFDRLATEAWRADQAALKGQTYYGTGAVLMMFHDATPLTTAGLTGPELANVGGITAGLDSEDSSQSYPDQDPRVAIAPGMFNATDEALRHLMRHEFVHVAFWSQSAGWSPTWLTEGMAEYFAWKGDVAPSLPVSVVRAAYAGQFGAPPATKTFYDGDYDSVALRYGEAWWMVDVLEARGGPEAAADVMREALGESTTEAQLEAFMAKRFHIDGAELGRLAQDEVRQHFEPPTA